jgi:glycosyltransferase involved in cell wall biosynthesis
MADRMAYRWATAVWHMYPERGQLKKYKHRTKCYDILDGNNFRQIQRLPADQINRFRLVYIGSINRDCRLEEGIMAVSRLKEEFPNTCLDIISSGDPAYEQRLKDLARKETILDRVTFHGQISDPEVYERLLCQCGLGLSLYQLDENDHAWYCTPLKVYLYAACGIPTILSDTIGPQTRGYLERDGIGVMAARGELAEVIRGVFTDRDRYLDMRARAIRWASQFDWEDKFDKFLSLV